jgi:hypothetical protein
MKVGLILESFLTIASACAQRRVNVTIVKHCINYYTCKSEYLSTWDCPAYEKGWICYEVF